eukprot:3468273-Rhodomonas_salina.1
MSLLHACVSEALRMQPPLIFLMRQVAPPSRFLADRGRKEGRKGLGQRGSEAARLRGSEREREKERERK